MKKTIMKFLGLAAFCGLGLSALAAPVAKVGTQEYDNIDDAMNAWVGGTTLTLLADVQLTATKSFPSSDAARTLNLSTFTMTAAKSKHAIQITNGGLQNTSCRLTVNADATNPGGITTSSSSYYGIYYWYTSGKDRVGVTINGGVFNGGALCMRTKGNTNAGAVQINGGTFNGSINLNRENTTISGGRFNGSFSVSVDSTCRLFIKGGSFKTFPIQTWSADLEAKMVLGSAVGTAVTKAMIDENPEAYPEFSGTYNYYNTSAKTWAYPLDKNGNYMWQSGKAPVHDAYVYVGDDGYFYVEPKSKLAARLEAVDFEASVTKNDANFGLHDVLLSISDVNVPVYYVSAAKAMTHTGVNKAITFYVSTDVSNMNLTGAEGNKFTVNLENDAVYSGEIGFTGGYAATKTVEGNVITYTARVPVALVDVNGTVYYDDMSAANAAINAAASGSVIKFLAETATQVKTLGAGETLTLVFAGGAYDYECLVKGAAGYSVKFDVNGSTVVATAVHDESKQQASTEGEGGQKQSYDTVKEAVEQAASGATVKLNPEATKESAPIVVGGGSGAGKQTAIDLNGGGIEAAPGEGEAAVKVAAGADLVIGDSSADGKGVVSAGDPEKTVVKVEEGSKATIEGGTYVGKLEVAEGAELVIRDGTFTDNPSDFIDPVLKEQGQVAKLSEDHSVWTVGEGEVKASAEIPETGAVTDRNGKPVEPTEPQQTAIDAVKAAVVAAVTADDAVAGATTGINDVTKDENGNLKPAILESIREQAAAQGVPSEVVEKIGESGVSSNFLNIAVKTVDVVVEGSEAKPATIVYEVTPKIETTVVKGDGTEVKVTTTVPNVEVAKRPMSFNLQVTDPTAQIAFVRHTGEGFAPDDFTCKVWEKDGKRYITVTVRHFSLFGVTYSSEVVVDSEETIGIVKVEKPEAGEVAFGVPFAKNGGANASFGELLVAGKAAGDTIRTFASAEGGYVATVATAEAVPGTAFWYDRAAASSVPLAVGGLVKDGLGATGAAGADGAPKMTLLMNPYRDTVDVTTVITMMHAGDEIVVEGGKVRYLWNGSAWTVKATDETAATIPVPAGKTFWYVSKSGAPQVAW